MTQMELSFVKEEYCMEILKILLITIKLFQILCIIRDMLIIKFLENPKFDIVCLIKTSYWKVPFANDQIGTTYNSGCALEGRLVYLEGHEASLSKVEPNPISISSIPLDKPKIRTLETMYTSIECNAMSYMKRVLYERKELIFLSKTIIFGESLVSYKENFVEKDKEYQRLRPIMKGINNIEFVSKKEKLRVRVKFESTVAKVKVYKNKIKYIEDYLSLFTSNEDHTPSFKKKFIYYRRII